MHTILSVKLHFGQLNVFNVI